MNNNRVGCCGGEIVGKRKCIELESMRAGNGDGRDELNLAEFPLCALAHRLPAERKTLRFEDRIWDKGRGEHVTRQLTVTGSDAFGLPTALDDEVLLGLIQLSRQHGFADRKVSFTRYQLIRLLGWRDDTKTYDRLEESLNRWTGVTLYYRNAWWDKRRGCWVDEKFHVIDNVWLCHRHDTRPDLGPGAPLSAFVWNDVLFRSFQGGNLKAIDFEFFKGLQSAIAKRLYRFLDKRFFHRRHWEFDLKELSWNHVGLSRGYDAASLKRKLRVGIVELERAGYLQPMPDHERFRKVCSGTWEVRFTQAESRTVAMSVTQADCAPSPSPLATALVERGVGAQAAEETVRKYPAEEIRTQVEALDWLVARKDSRVSRNPPGFLLSAIQGGYATPPGFIGSAEQERREQERRARLEITAKQQIRREERERRHEEMQQQAVDQFLERLPSDERLQLENEAVRSALTLQRSLIQKGGRLAVAARKLAIENYVLRVLGKIA
jgi:hypothetical protein